MYGLNVMYNLNLVYNVMYQESLEKLGKIFFGPYNKFLGGMYL